jgi:ABC-type glycerol-3-phosphate transport system permease component
MQNDIEIIVSWGSLLIGVIACMFVGWLLIRAVHRGRVGRFLATVIYGGAIPVTGAVPLLIALGARWLGTLAGFALFSGNGGNDGNLVGVGIMGMIVALGATVLFAAVMLFQALTGSGSSYVDDKE